VTFYIGYAGASRKSPNEPPWETLTQLICFCKHLTPVRISSGDLHTPDTGYDICRVPAGHLHPPDTDKGTCIPLTPVRVSAEYLQGTCIPLTPVRVSAGYLQGTCIPLTLIRVRKKERLLKDRTLSINIM